MTTLAPQRADVTPDWLVHQMVNLLGATPECQVFEPCAGRGVFAEALRPNVRSTISIELNADLSLALRKRGYDCAHGNVLNLRAGMIGHYDRVIFNPPFKNGVCWKIANKAIEFVRPGGRMVCVVDSDYRFTTNADGQAFAINCMRHDATTIDLPPGSFEMDGKEVRVTIVVFDL